MASSGKLRTLSAKETRTRRRNHERTRWIYYTSFDVRVTRSRRSIRRGKGIPDFANNRHKQLKRYWPLREPVLGAFLVWSQASKMSMHMEWDWWTIWVYIVYIVLEEMTRKCFAKMRAKGPFLNVKRTWRKDLNWKNAHANRPGEPSQSSHGEGLAIGKPLKDVNIEHRHEIQPNTSQ